MCQRDVSSRPSTDGLDDKGIFLFIMFFATQITPPMESCVGLVINDTKNLPCELSCESSD